MRALVLIAIGLAPSCKSVECGPGTFEENGICVPADNTVSAAACGPFTELVGGQCVPTFPPTVCDPQSTQEELVKLRESGKVKAIGVSIHDRARAGRLAASSPLDLLMVRYNAAHPGAEEVGAPFALLRQRLPAMAQSPRSVGPVA